MLRFKLKERIALKEFQLGRRVTLLEIASDTGIGRITLSRMLNRGANVRSDTIDRLCKYFGCKVEDLVEYVDDGAGPAKTGQRMAGTNQRRKTTTRRAAIKGD